MKRDDLNSLKKHAKARGGAVESPVYINAHQKIMWRCVNDHVWLASWANVKRGGWCPACAFRPSINIDNATKVAEQFGGKCLSKRYKNSHSKLHWECRSGHHWQATYANVNSGSWCPKCSNREKFTMTEVQLFAKARGGKVLSKQYNNRTAPLTWSCAHQHKWHASLATVQGGAWCPVCGKSSEDKSMKNIRKQIIKGLIESKTLVPDIDFNVVTFEASSHQWPVGPIKIKVNERNVEVELDVATTAEAYAGEDIDQETLASRHSDFASNVSSQFFQGSKFEIQGSDNDGDSEIQWDVYWATLNFDKLSPKEVVKAVNDLVTKPAPKSF